MIIRGHTSYKGYTAQQHDDVFLTFKDFLNEIKPKRILEIGTAGGGFTLFLRDTLDENGYQNAEIKSFDVVETPWYDKIRENNIEINIENIFNMQYNKIVKPEKIIPFIQQDGVTLVLCDGGHKIGEFNSIAYHIKSGDFIMAHDYIDTYDNFNNNFKDKIWNWCEIKDDDIKSAVIDNNLISYNKEQFDKVVWVCKKKI